jgi:hypothetical protein
MTEERPLYPVEPWRIRELAFDPDLAARNEAIFSLANGHLGLRGNLEEEAGNVAHGTYVNGFFEETPIAYGEAAYGFARNHQVLLNLAEEADRAARRRRARFGIDRRGVERTLTCAPAWSPDGALAIVRRRRRGATARRLVSLCARASRRSTTRDGRGRHGADPDRVGDQRPGAQTGGLDDRASVRTCRRALRTVHREASGTWAPWSSGRG